MKLLIFGKNACDICTKAKGIADRLNIPYEYHSILPDDYDRTDKKQEAELLTTLSDFYWHDGYPEITLPLVVAICKGCGEPIKDGRWTGKEISDPTTSWMETMKNFLKHNSDCKKGKK